MSTIASHEEDFSSNAHTPQVEAHSRFQGQYEVPNRHPGLFFADGNIAVLCGHQYFIVHQSVLFHHSTILRDLAEASMADERKLLLEGQPVLRLPHSPDEVYILLRCLYGCVQCF